MCTKAKTFAAALLPCIFTVATPVRAEEIVKDGWNFGPLPCVSYNSDLGLQYGVCADIFNYTGVFPDYRQRIYVEASRYTKGQTLLHAQFDSRYLIPGIRTTFSASYQYDPMFLFYGLGGLEDYDAALDCNKDTRTARYNYKRSMVRVLTNFQGTISGNLNWIAGLNFWNYTLGDIQMDSYDAESTLFAQMRAAGVISGAEAEGSSLLEVNAGFSFDSRDNTAAPDSGIWAEVYLTASPNLTDRQYNFLRLSAHWRHYVTIFPERLVFAYHLAYQGVIAGQAPFCHLQDISTLYLNQTCTDGLGGINTVRGLVAQKLVGSNYAWLNAELRLKLFSFNLLNQSWYVATNPFFDAGMVTSLCKADELASFYGRSAEDLRRDAVKPRCSAGLGLKLAMNQNFIVSAEYAKPFSAADGPGTVYIALNYVF